MFISTQVKQFTQRVRLIFFLILISILFACERNNRSQFFALGTIITADIRSVPETAEKFLIELQTITTQQNKQFYAWGNGELANINRLLKSADCARNVDQDTITLFSKAKELNMQSNFLFEPSIAPLVELWGFHDATKMLSEIPNPAAIEAKLNKISTIQALDITENSLCPRDPMQIDLGAIAKGWAAKNANKILDQHFINNALVDFGGDLILRGTVAKGKAWTIGLRDPDSKENPMASFKLSTNGQSLAVFTSGDYERQFTVNGKNYHHILDPRTGYPATETRSVTVIHQDPVIADAAATALFIAGTNWKKVAKAMSLQDVLIIFPNNQAVVSTSLQNKTSWLNSTYLVTVVDVNNEDSN